MADPTYANDLVLVSVFFKHDAILREAMCTYAINDNTVNYSAQQWADNQFTNWKNQFKAQLDTAARLMRVETLKGDGTATFETGLSTAAPERGTNAMSSTPPNCAILAKKTTGLGGRRNRGRMYLPFMLNEGEVDEAGAISAGVVSDVQGHLDDLKDDITTGTDAEMVIAQRIYDAAWDIPTRRLVSVEMGPTVTVLTCEGMTATQRRRMPRG